VTGAAGASAPHPTPFDGGAFDAGPPEVHHGAFDAGSTICDDQVNTPPPGKFVSISAGNSATCGLRPDGSLECWGESFFPLPVGAAFKYKDVSVQTGVCAVRLSGEIDCWGQSPDQNAPPPGPFERVVAAEDGACALRADKSVACWGRPGHAEYAPPYKFEALTGGAYYMCGLEASSRAIACWEPRVGAETVMLVPGPFLEVDTGRFMACGTHVDHTVSCWSTETGPASTMYVFAVPPGHYSRLSVGEFHACALREDGQATCWGEPDTQERYVPPGIVLNWVSAGSYHTCGILPDATVRCWGRVPFCSG
jgi:hypothetical protein